MLNQMTFPKFDEINSTQPAGSNKKFRMFFISAWSRFVVHKKQRTPVATGALWFTQPSSELYILQRQQFSLYFWHPLPQIGSFWHLCDGIFWPIIDPCPPQLLTYYDLLYGWPSTWMRLFGLGSFNIVHLEEIFKELTNFRHSAPTLPPSLPAPPPPPFALFRYVVCTYLYSMYILRDSLKPYIITK